MEVKVKLKKCKNCKSQFKPYKSTDKICSISCAISYSKKLEVEKKAKSIRKERIEFNYNNSKWLKSKINTNLQAIARYIDYGLPCLANPTTSRNGVGNTRFDGGHLWSKGAHPQCKWNLHNIHRQNAGSNNKGSDDVLMFIGIEREYGLEYRKFVESFKGTPIIKLSIPELQEIYQKSNEIKRELNKELITFSKDKRIELRNQINEDLGIYPGELSIFEN